MSNGRTDRRGVGLLWLVAAVGAGATIWAACTDSGTLSYRTCTAAPAATSPRTAAPGTGVAATAVVLLAWPVPRTSPGPARPAGTPGVLACAG
ncbi:hypothetical protein I6A60_30575 [Frankia sp. AgB1.9]|uniref:hypothetical protein n=1 Tax=unclassified Frankia TaxID=2632575 RepID=UPI001931F06C|nr:MULTISPECIES: hypothetical protein [unclassified Frankia]MBL7489591.1 hypothetical protein [Frankia sp. AgW1.1]MBL7552175.1 hypothetical protein [Frankia sp. AgB1.9]MBL7624476.1 hypothetical protein [Frankia sp. AgB1.8]